MKTRSEISKEYYRKNRERILSRKRELYNREYHSAKYNAWYEFNQEYKKEYDRKRYLAKKEKEGNKFIVSFD